MKKEKNELGQFLVGLTMLVVGLFLFTQRVVVTSNWGMGFNLGGISIGSGLVIVPFIIGIIMIFVNPDSFLSKLVASLGLLIIIASVIASTRIQLMRTTLFDWLLFMVLIFGGLAMVCKILFKERSSK